jgi:hypothetical protein
MNKDFINSSVENTPGRLSALSNKKLATLNVF